MVKEVSMREVTMLIKAILICGLASYLTEAAVIKGETFYFRPIFIPFSGPFSRGFTYQQCSVGEGEERGKINDGYIKEASGLAYSRRSPKVKIYFVVTSLHEN